MNQLGLPISLNTSMLLENFVENEELLRSINQLFFDENSSEVFIYGGSGQGKTHVLQGAVLKALEMDKNAIYLDCSETFHEHILDFIDQIDFISFDNVHLISSENQEVFFDLYNRGRQNQIFILVSADSLPSDLDVMKDIKTRLSLAAVYKLKELDDDLIIQVLNAQMSDRNLSVDPKIYKYLFKNYSRDLKSLLFIMDELDKASLQAKKAISISFVRKFLNLNTN